MAVLLGYPTRIYLIANRQSGHRRTTSRAQVQARVKQQQTVTVQQIVIVTVVQTAIVHWIVRLIVQRIAIVIVLMEFI